MRVSAKYFELMVPIYCLYFYIITEINAKLRIYYFDLLSSVWAKY